MREVVVRLLPLLLWFACKHPAPPVDPAGSSVSAAPWAVGDWSGALWIPSGVAVRLVVHVTEADGGLAATLDSPDQRAFALPVERVTVDGDRLVLEAPVIRGRFEGSYDGEQIAGTWSQGSALPLTLTRGVLPEVRVERPQEPQAPFPYVVEEVEIPSADGVILSGTLTRPDGDGADPWRRADLGLRTAGSR